MVKVWIQDMFFANWQHKSACIKTVDVWVTINPGLNFKFHLRVFLKTLIDILVEHVASAMTNRPISTKIHFEIDL